MIAKISLLAFILVIITITGFTQEKSKKELKEEKKIEKQKDVEEMINAKDFVFIARSAMQAGVQPISLDPNSNYVKFHPEFIQCSMPYHGPAQSGGGFGGDSPIIFKGKPEVYTVIKGKKNFQVDASFKGEKDNYQISLSISFEGSGTLSLNSNNRRPISYTGEIKSQEKKEEKTD